jgi:hypothetical protein
MGCPDAVLVVVVLGVAGVAPLFVWPPEERATAPSPRAPEDTLASPDAEVRFERVMAKEASGLHT